MHLLGISHLLPYGFLVLLLEWLAGFLLHYHIIQVKFFRGVFGLQH